MNQNDKKNSKQKLLTIAIPTYNRANTCKSTVENLAEQIIDNKLENEVDIIISDNCSEDATPEILLNLKNKYKNVISIHRQKHNIGGGANCAYLIETCTSEYIQICSDDDIYDKNMIADSIKIIKQEKPQYIFLNCEWPQHRTRSVNIDKDFRGEFSEALKLVSITASHISPTIIKTNLIKDTEYINKEWIELEKLVKIQENGLSYISAKPYVKYSVPYGEVHWLDKPRLRHKYFTNLLEFCLVEDQNEMFKNIRQDLINQCLESFDIEKIYPKFNKTKKRLKKRYLTIIVILSLLLTIQSIILIYYIFL